MAQHGEHSMRKPTNQPNNRQMETVAVILDVTLETYLWIWLMRIYNL